MKYFAGIDGGSLKTKCIVCNENGEIVNSSFLGSSNKNIVGEDKAIEIIKNCVKQIGCPHLEAIYIGMSGFKKERDNDFENKLKNSFNTKVIVDSDTKIALFAGTLGKPGIVVISGAGSIVFGYDGKNEERVSGHGWMLGDDHSGYGIGIKAIKATLKCFEGTGPQTVLYPKLLDYYEVENINQLIKKIYNKEIDRNKIACSTKHIAKLAEMDSLIKNIFSDVGMGLADEATVLIKKMKLENVPIVLVGGVFECGELIINPLRNQLKKNGVNFELVKPQIDPAYTAALLALRSVL